MARVQHRSLVKNQSNRFLIGSILIAPCFGVLGLGVPIITVTLHDTLVFPHLTSEDPMHGIEYISTLERSIFVIT